MKIIFKKTFLKQYQKLQNNEQTKVDQALLLFEKNPFYPRLNNHALKGRLEGKRSISAGFDLRLIFEMQGGNILVVFLGVGHHGQVY